jgi:hypothetical protein
MLWKEKYIPNNLSKVQFLDSKAIVHFDMCIDEVSFYIRNWMENTCRYTCRVNYMCMPFSTSIGYYTPSFSFYKACTQIKIQTLRSLTNSLRINFYFLV